MAAAGIAATAASNLTSRHHTTEGRWTAAFFERRGRPQEKKSGGAGSQSGLATRIEPTLSLIPFFSTWRL